MIATLAAVQTAKQGLPACKAIDPKAWNQDLFEQTMDIAEHPFEHFELLENDVKINGISIIDDSKIAVDAYTAGDYKTFGKKMGEILKLATHKKEEVEEWKNPLMLAEVTQGFFTATNVGHFNFTNLLICIYQMDQSAIGLYAAVNILEDAIKDKKLIELIGSVLFAVQSYQQFKQALPTCEAIDTSVADWTTFDKIVATLEDPEKNMEQIEENIVMNGVTLTEDMKDAVEAFKSGEFRDFGFLLGQMLTQASMTPAAEKNLFLY